MHPAPPSLDPQIVALVRNRVAALRDARARTAAVMFLAELAYTQTVAHHQALAHARAELRISRRVMRASRRVAAR